MTLFGGGFGAEAKLLIQQLGADFDFAYVVSPWSKPEKLAPLPEGPLYVLDEVVRFLQPSRLRTAWLVLVATVRSISIVGRAKPDVVVAFGSATCVPLLIAARLRRRQTVFIESVTRVEIPSLTTRIVSRLRLADRIYVQWPGLETGLHNAIYRGSIF